jgi:cytochrome c oxidase subunit 3
MTIKSNHIFHIVDLSPWPLTRAISLLSIALGLVQWFHTGSQTLIITRISLIFISSFQWWRDISREATFQGLHTSRVTTGLRMGIILFIFSEVIFFLSFFWAFLHRSLAPVVELGIVWPPLGVVPFNPTQIPLLNTIVLLSSGASVTWAHHALLSKNVTETNQALIITIILGGYFTALQILEYWEAFFRISDSIYGATFFLATGFHGLHVIIGTLFILVCLLRHFYAHFSSSHHFGFEAAAWYWHFVDVVWMFLYISIYWWGG